MKTSILAAILSISFSTAAASAQPAAESAPGFQFATTSELKSNSLVAVEARTTSVEVCWATYTACMLSCGYYDPAQFPVDACSEACFNEYLGCAGF
ncbi:MAG: hypothetical protein ACK5PG_05270 [Lysobacterales bacterium]